MQWKIPLLAFGALSSGITGPAHAEQVTWHFDNLDRIGCSPVQVEGPPSLVDGPAGPDGAIGRAIQFDGIDDTILIDGRPIAGASNFTIEVAFRPEGGKFEQRFMHIAETDPLTDENVRMEGRGDRNPRLMFEVRVVEDGWYLDTFVNSQAGSQPLIFPDKVYPLGRWYVAAQSYDGTTYRAYVDGILQGESDVAFFPHGPGRVRLGARMNKVDYFLGSIAWARFTDRALPAEELLKIPIS